MKGKNKRNNQIYIPVFAFILLIILLLSNKPSIPTGGVQLNIQEDIKIAHAYSLNDWINKFFDTNGIVFSKGTCSDVAQDLLRLSLNERLQVTEQFTTQGNQKVSSLMFGIKQEFVGALEMIYGKDLVKKEDSDSLLNFWSEAIVRLPRLERTTEIEVTLYGNSKDKFYVNHGKFTTPMIECDFSFDEFEKEVCNCRTERTHEYINE